jgi:hypothetical protein
MTSITTHESIEVVCGDTWEINGLITDEDGVPMSLSGVGINWKLDTMDGDANLLDLSVGSGITLVDPNNGVILITVSKTASAALVPGIYYDWLRITLVDGTAYTEWTGVIQAIKNPKAALAMVL